MWEIRKSLPLPTVRDVKFIEVQREYREEREYKVQREYKEEREYKVYVKAYIHIEKVLTATYLL